MTKYAVWIAIFVGFSLSAFAQLLDGYKLRDKYGTPLDRETFTVRWGIEMVVDYGPSKQVCRIQLPSGTQYGGTIPDGAVTKQIVEEVLQEVVPASMRGKVVNRLTFRSGAYTRSTVIYEHFTMIEVPNIEVGSGISVIFRDAACQLPTLPKVQ